MGGRPRVAPSFAPEHVRGSYLAGPSAGDGGERHGARDRGDDHRGDRPERRHRIVDQADASGEGAPERAPEARLVPATGPATGAGTLEGIAVSGTDDELFSTEVDWTLG